MFILPGSRSLRHGLPNGAWNPLTRTLTLTSGPWNNAAATFTGFKFNVTNIASATASNLFDFQINGTSYFYANTDGAITMRQVTSAISTNGLSIAGISGASRIGLSGETAAITFVNQSGYSFLVTSNINATINMGGGTVLVGDEVTRNLAVRNGTSSTGFRVYNTTDNNFGAPATDYERGVFDWTTTANVLTIGTQAGGTGTLRPVTLIGQSLQLNGDVGNIVDIAAGGSGGSGVDFRFGGDDLNFGALTSRILWSGTGTVTVGVDLGLARNAAGVLEINNGTLGTYAALRTTQVSYPQIDKGTPGAGTVTFDVSANQKGKLTIGAIQTIAFSNWPASGIYGEYEIQLVNGGAFAVTWPTVNWLKGDGTSSTTFSSMGVTLQSIGTNYIVVWSTDGGTTLYGKAI